MDENPRWRRASNRSPSKTYTIQVKIQRPRGEKTEKIAKIDINRQKKDLKKAQKEYDAFSKDMYKKVGRTGKIKVSKNEQGKKIYTNKQNKTFKEFEVIGAREYELNRGAKIASIYANTVAISAGLMFVNSIIKR